MLSCRCITRAAVASLLLSATATALATDYQVALNYNWNGMYHLGEENQPDNLNGFRSISDRALSLDGGGNSFGGTPIIGSTGITYTFNNTAFTLDIVHLGNTGVGMAKNWDNATDADNLGVRPSWLADNAAHTQPQTTTLPSPILLDSNSSIGILYHVSNSGGNFDVVLNFTDSTSITVTLRGADWFGPTNPPAPLAGVASQTRLNGTTFQGTSNGDSPIVQPWPTQALAVTEGIITTASLSSAGLGNIAGKSLTSITFQNPNLASKGYAIFSTTVVSGLGPPLNDNCAQAQLVTIGDTATNNLRATGSTTTSCGSNDTTDVWYRYVAPNSGISEARTCGANFDTTIAVYNACGGTLLACNNDGCGLASRVQWNATGGQQYFIRVAGNNATTGLFNLFIDSAATAHSDVAVPLAYNWNGMTHAGEAGQPDAPMGYRSIADRGLLADGIAGSINAGATVGDGFIRYTIAPNANEVDMIALNNRAFNTFAGDNIGSTPNWLVGGNDQSGPFTSDLTGLNAFMGANTRIGVLYHMANGGGTIDCTLTFSDSSNITLQLAAPDWYLDQSPTGPLSGVEVQRQFGVLNASRDADNADLGAPPLNVVEAVISTSSLMNAGWGDTTGRRLTGITFGNRFPINTQAGIFAVTIRDGGVPTGPIPPAGSGTASPSSVAITGSTVLKVAVAPGFNPTSTGITVSGNLSSISGPGFQPFYNDGTHGDAVAGDNIYSVLVTLAEPMSAGPVSIPFTVADAQGRSSGGSINLNATAAPSGQCCTAGSCSVTTAFLCAQGGGTYNGNGTNCAGNATTPFVSTDAFPLAIPDGGVTPGVMSTSFNISGGGTITNLAVRIGLTHTYMSDLTATLSNGVTTVTLFDDNGGGNDVNNATFTFHDLAALDFATGAGTNPIPSGDYRPVQGLSAFDGQPFNGTWTLTVSDAFGADIGTINSFSIGSAAPAFCGSGCATADFNGDGDFGTDADIEAFFACLSGNCCSTCWYLGADFNADGDTGTDSDIEAFFRVLAGNPC